jgi:hypothetical protein
MWSEGRRVSTSAAGRQRIKRWGDVNVTTIDRAAARGVRKPVAQAAILIITALGLAGCETGSSLFSSNGDATTTPLAGQLPPGTTQKAKMAVAPIVGPPDATSRSLQTQVIAALERKNISVAKQPTDASEYTLRGYVVAAKEKASTKVSYIWDVTDPAGKRVNRITGEEVSPGAGSSDTWSAVTPQVVDQIANKTATSVATWLPSQGGAGAAPAAAAVPVAAAPAAARPIAAAAPPPAATTGSIGRTGPLQASVPNVTGAPGDGSIALTGAIQRELTRNGVSLTSGTAQAYKVEGKVTVGAVKDGKQPVTIDWHVKDPAGKQLGTVSQKNEVPQGSLDGAWGKTADAAAAAAAQGIIKLLPKTN